MQLTYPTGQICYQELKCFASYTERHFPLLPVLILYYFRCWNSNDWSAFR